MTKDQFAAALDRICEEHEKSAVANFFDNDLVIIFHTIKGYLESHTPTEMLADIRGSGISPNELPSLGDHALQRYKQYAHAQVLYAEGIRQLEAAPHLLAPDCNLLFARRNLCMSCHMLGSAVEAFSVIANEPELIAADINLTLFVANALVETGHPEKANALLSATDQIPLPDLLQKLEATQWSFDELDSLKALVRQQLGTRKMCDLNWLSAPGSGQLPERLLNMDLDQLAKHGVPAELLSAVKTAVLLGAGQDRKMWNCSFFDIEDPMPLLSRGMPGRFRVLFHNRLGKYGEDGSVTVFGVYRD